MVAADEIRSGSRLYMILCVNDVSGLALFLLDLNGSVRTFLLIGPRWRRT